jgi:basic membrane protein A and related proteins
MARRSRSSRALARPEKEGKVMKKLLAALAALVLLTGAAHASDIVPGLLYDIGGKFDKSFSEAAYEGAEQFKKETGLKYVDFEVSNEAQRQQALRRFAEDGRNPIVMAGFAWGAALTSVVDDYPQTTFVIIDTVVDKPNVHSILYEEHEGSYLVGLMGAMTSKTKKLGFVGGMDIPLIRKFACGYVGGAKAGGATEIIQNYTGDTPAAWNDPTRGGEIAMSQIAQGADVVYQAAGGTGVGVLRAAADTGKLGIGCNSNQNYLQPGSVLTSMLKRVDVAVYNSFKDASEGKFATGVTVLGVKEGAIGFSMDEYNKPLVSAEVLTAVKQAESDIISGALKVHDYTTDDNCPY